MVAQDILVVLVLVRTQVSQPKTAPENHFRGCLYFTIIRTLSVYLCSTYIRCGHIYTPSRHEIKRHTTLRQTHLILPLLFFCGKRFFNLRRMIFQSAANDFPFCTDLFRPLPEQNCNQVCTPNSCVLWHFSPIFALTKTRTAEMMKKQLHAITCYGSACLSRPVFGSHPHHHPCP